MPNKPAEIEGLPKKEKDISGVRTRVDFATQFGLRVIKEVSVGKSVSFKDPKNGAETEIIVDKSGQVISILAKKQMRGFYSWQGEGAIPGEFNEMIKSVSEIIGKHEEEDKLALYLRQLTRNVIRMP